MSKALNTPYLKRRLFWDYDYDNIDWQKEAVGVIERVIERGSHEEWKNLLQFYGQTKVLGVIKKEIKFLPDEIVHDVCQYFGLKSDDLTGYTKKKVAAETLDLIRRLLADPAFKDFILVGGRALSLQIGHRISEDIDLFSTHSFDSFAVSTYLREKYKAENIKNRQRDHKTK